MKKLICILVFFLAFPLTVQAALIKGHIISFPDDPIKINVVEASSYKKKYSQGMIFIQLNISAKDVIDAAQFNLILYDVFNEYLDTFGAVAKEVILPENETQLYWEDVIVNNGWMAYTAIVYLDKVRLRNGAVWKQNRKRVAEEIRKIEGIFFEETQLEEKEKREQSTEGG